MPAPRPAATLCAELRADPTESPLNDGVDPDDSPCLPNLDHDPDTVGHVFVTVADGWILLPARRLNPEAGWEPIDVNGAQLLPPDPAWPAQLAAYWQALDALREATLALLEHAQPVPRPASANPLPSPGP